MKRRRFLHTSLKAGVVATSLGPLFRPFTARAFANAPSIAQAAWMAGTGRVLVIVQLDGGNDGLNTVVPHTDDLYHNYRGPLAIQSPLRINDTLGWHPAMTGFERMYNEGSVAVVQNVGYPNPNRSHFRSTDVYFTGSNNTVPADRNTYLDDGWVGRYLDWRNPGYPDVSPEHPLALQIGTSTTLLLQGPVYGMGMAVNDPISFYRIIDGTDISGAEKPDTSTPAGLELDYIQRISAEALAYARPVRDAFNSTQNQATYGPGIVSDQLKIIARLIAGGLETPVYIISQRGYDTHSAQASRHQSLLGQLSDGVASFFDDLKSLGVADRVALMTISEFGRRVQANGLDTPGQEGTDHGTCAPMFFVGPEVNGGVYGHDPDLANLQFNDIVYEYDFKQTYASTLKQWFGVNDSSTALLLKGEFTQLPLFVQGPVGVSASRAPDAFGLEQNFPNPAPAGTRTAIPYRTTGGRTTLRVYDLQGRLVKTLVDNDLPPGPHRAELSLAGLPSGTYVYRLESHGRAETRSMVVNR